MDELVQTQGEDMNVDSKPITAAGWAMLHRIADGDTDELSQLLGYFRDPEDAAGERWQFLRAAEANVWRAADLLFLRRMIERRFRDGDLDAWTRTTPLGQEILDGLNSFFECHAPLEFPSEPSFGAFAYQELCAARLAGEIHAEVSEPANNPEAIMEQMAASLERRFPMLTKAIRHPALDIAGLTWGFMDWFIRYNFETQVALPTTRTPPPNAGLEDLAVLMLNCPSRVAEFTSDVYAQAEFARRVKLKEMRMSIRNQSDDDLKREAIFNGKSRFVKSPDQAFLSLPVETLGASSEVAGFESLSAPFALAGFESVGAPSLGAALAWRRASSDSDSAALFTAER